MKILKLIHLPDILQNDDYSFGIYCVQSIMAYYGEDWWEPELAKEMHVTNNGTLIKEITKFFKLQNFKVFSGKFTIKKLVGTLKRNIPVILFIQAWNMDDKIKKYKQDEEHGHYVIAVGYTKEAIIFEDPAIFGRGFLKFSELKTRWHGYDDDDKIINNLGIAVWGKKPFNFKKFIHLENKNYG